MDRNINLSQSIRELKKERFFVFLSRGLVLSICVIIIINILGYLLEKANSHSDIIILLYPIATLFVIAAFLLLPVLIIYICYYFLKKNRGNNKGKR